MPKRLEQALSGQEENYLLPFLWQHGEEEAIIREEMERVHATHIRAVCVEARPHPDFYGPRWWKDFEIIMDEARARGMRVWLLDDDHFPTGHARGQMENKPKELRRLFIREIHRDALGPQAHAAFFTQPRAFNFGPPGGKENFEVLAVVAAKRDPHSERLSGELIDLTEQVENGMLYWDVPEGFWRVFIVGETNSIGSEHHQDYINMLVPESVRVLIDAVYEPMYERYGAEFGKTFAGFFSDEPGFYNDRETFNMYSSVGTPGAALPWRPGLLELLSRAFGQEMRKYLPLLWHTGDETTASVRETYMDQITRLYASAFTQQLGDWCAAHGVEYIGHVLEDNDVHARLGPGPGHYFRALWGQHMSGIDVVLWSLVPGFDDGPFASIAGNADGEFYHYGLTKLASSLAHIDPKKQGRAMVELFGAYGWREGLKMMKWMTDFMLVRGINVFVPHAFSQAEFPDPDCPPHLYARGKNPQYRYYHYLNDYTNRAAHLLSGGQHLAPLAVLYHAEASWAGEAMLFKVAVKQLLRGQIDCDVLPMDVLVENSRMEGNALHVNQESYQALVIPASEVLPERLAERLYELAEEGLSLIFLERFPARTTGTSTRLEMLVRHRNARMVRVEALANEARELGFYEVETEDFQPNLRYLHMRQPDGDVWMFSNDHPIQTIQTGVTLPGGQLLANYDPYTNQIYRLAARQEGERVHFLLRLEPYQTLFLVSGAGEAPTAPALPEQVKELSTAWSISTASAGQYPTFTPYRADAALADFSRAEMLPAFSGTFRYEAEIEWEGSNERAVLDLGEVYETSEVWINGIQAGACICPPYRHDVSGLLRSGTNRLAIEVTNTLVKEEPDFFSTYAAQEPSGLLGPVRIYHQTGTQP